MAPNLLGPGFRGGALPPRLIGIADFSTLAGGAGGRTITSVVMPPAANFLVVSYIGRSTTADALGTTTCSFNGTSLPLITRIGDLASDNNLWLCGFFGGPVAAATANLVITQSAGNYNGGFGVVIYAMFVSNGGVTLDSDTGNPAGAPASDTLSIDTTAPSVVFQNACYSTVTGTFAMGPGDMTVAATTAASTHAYAIESAPLTGYAPIISATTIARISHCAYALGNG